MALRLEPEKGFWVEGWRLWCRVKQVTRARTGGVYTYQGLTICGGTFDSRVISYFRKTKPRIYICKHCTNKPAVADGPPKE